MARTVHHSEEDRTGDHADKGMDKQTYHVNLLNEWKEPPVKQGMVMMVREVMDVTDKEPESEAKKKKKNRENQLR